MFRGLKTLVVIGLVALLAACSGGPVVPQGDAQVVVVGDSILAWHRGTGRSIPDVAAQASGLAVANLSVSGARFLGRGGIPAQFEAGDWDWVILNGGGNDLRPVCGTADAGRVLDALISEDGTRGAIPEFAGRAVASGARVIVLGYYPVSLRGGPFVPCIGVLDELAKRQQRLTEARAEVVFVDSGQVIRPQDAGAYAFDLVHPSPNGAAAVGRLVGSVMRGAQP